MKLQTTAQTGAKTFEEAFKEFIQYCRVRNYSRSTINNYRQLYTQLSRYWNTEQSLSEFTSPVVDGFLLYLKEDCKLSDMSLGMYYKNLKAVVNYCVKLGYMKPVTFPKLRLEKKVKETYTDQELEALLKKPNIERCDFCEYRNWVIINYLLSTGNRVSTVINLQIGDIDFESQLIRLTKTKNRKQQIIPLSGTLAYLLKVSAPVIKCRKAPVKKCRFSAERNAIWYTQICL